MFLRLQRSFPRSLQVHFRFRSMCSFTSSSNKGAPLQRNTSATWVWFSDVVSICRLGAHRNLPRTILPRAPRLALKQFTPHDYGTRSTVGRPWQVCPHDFGPCSTVRCPKQVTPHDFGPIPRAGRPKQFTPHDTLSHSGNDGTSPVARSCNALVPELAKDPP